MEVTQEMKLQSKLKSQNRMAQVLQDTTPIFKPVLDKKTILLTKDRPAESYISPRKKNEQASTGQKVQPTLLSQKSHKIVINKFKEDFYAVCSKEVLTVDECRDVVNVLGFKSNQKCKNAQLELQLIDGLVDTAVTEGNLVKQEDLL